MTIEQRIRAQQTKEFVGIPISLPRLNTALCGIDRGDWLLITGQTSTYKSSFTMGQIAISMVDWLLDREASGVSGKVFYFLLEENREDLENRMVSYLYDKLCQRIVSENQIMHRLDERISDADLTLLPLIQKRMDKLLAQIEIIDYIRYPVSIYNYVEAYMTDHGQVTYVTLDGIKQPSRYIPNDPDHYVLLIIDHIGDLYPVQGQTLNQAIEDLSNKYLMRFKNVFRVIPIIVQQQTNVGDQIDTDYKGQTIETKLSPSTAKLADNKTIGKRATTIISLFNPATYELNQYKGYTNIKGMNGQFLYLEILKNRRGPKQIGGGMWVNPVTKIMEEMPQPADQMAVIDFVNARLGPPKSGVQKPLFDFKQLQ